MTTSDDRRARCEARRASYYPRKSLSEVTLPPVTNWPAIDPDTWDRVISKTAEWALKEAMFKAPFSAENDLTTPVSQVALAVIRELEHRGKRELEPGHPPLTDPQTEHHTKQERPEWHPDWRPRY